MLFCCCLHKSSIHRGDVPLPLDNRYFLLSDLVELTELFCSCTTSYLLSNCQCSLVYRSWAKVVQSYGEKQSDSKFCLNFNNCLTFQPRFGSLPGHRCGPASQKRVQNYNTRTRFPNFLTTFLCCKTYFLAFCHQISLFHPVSARHRVPQKKPPGPVGLTFAPDMLKKRR